MTTAPVDAATLPPFSNRSGLPALRRLRADPVHFDRDCAATTLIDVARAEPRGSRAAANGPGAGVVIGYFGRTTISLPPWERQNREA